MGTRRQVSCGLRQGWWASAIRQYTGAKRMGYLPAWTFGSA